MVNHFLKAWHAADWPTAEACLREDVGLKWFNEGLIYGRETVIERLASTPLKAKPSCAPYLSYELVHTNLTGIDCWVKMITVDQKIALIDVVADDPTQHRVRFTMRYDGSRYAGFQRQPKGKTIQNEVEAALEKLFARPIDIYAASRTDAGVHADKQVFHADLPAKIDHVEQLLNRILPKDLHILAADPVPIVFHSRFDARQKTYRYRLHHHVDPFLAHHSLYSEPLDIERLNGKLKQFQGTHDFQAFTVRNDKENTIRTIHTALAYKEHDSTIIEITGNGFLRHMVRIMVGHALHDLKENTRTIVAMIAAPDGRHRIVMAPPTGLYLHDIDYQSV